MGKSRVFPLKAVPVFCYSFTHSAWSEAWHTKKRGECCFPPPKAQWEQPVCPLALAQEPQPGFSFDRKRALGPNFIKFFLYSGFQFPHFLCLETILQDKFKP